MKNYKTFVSEAKIKLKDGEVVEVNDKTAALLKKKKGSDKNLITMLKAMGK